MDITPLIAKDAKILQGYGDGGFTINGEKVQGHILLHPSAVIPWAFHTIEELKIHHFTPLIERGIELLLIGSGKRVVLLPMELRQTLKQQGIAVDVMDTGAACRTYNVLLSEARKVAAALVAV